LSLEEALSCVTPPIRYSLNATTSTTTTQVDCSSRPTRVLLWETFFEEGVRDAFNNNICMVLNVLMASYYDFSRRPTAAPGIEDFTCYYAQKVLILSIEIKRGLVLQNIGGRVFPDFYDSDNKAKMVIQQIYNYMTFNELQYGVLSTYNEHWFLRRPADTPAVLLISKTLSSQSESPSVLKAYAYIALQARAHPNSSNLNVIPDVTNQPYQQNFSFADFKFKHILGQGRSGKTLLSEF
ncbi:10393_t:CDS:2, partial [Ambispora gerdemannii]